MDGMKRGFEICKWTLEDLQQNANLTSSRARYKKKYMKSLIHTFDTFLNIKGYQ